MLVELVADLAARIAPAVDPIPVQQWPPDGVAEPAIWVEATEGGEAAGLRSVTLDVVLVVPVGHGNYPTLATLVEACWDALEGWRPTTGAALRRSEVRWFLTDEAIAGDRVPAARITVPMSYRYC